LGDQANRPFVFRPSSLRMPKTDQLFSDGEAYERLMGRWSRLVAKEFLAWPDTPNSLRWLDVGCGNGAFTEELITHGAPANVIAIDPSPDQLAYARTRMGAQAAEFQQGDAENLAFGSGSFDVAVMALVISFLNDPARALAEMKRVVRPGGWVATYMWDIPGGGVPVDPIYKAVKSLGIGLVLPPNSAVSQRHAMQQLWERAGLVFIETTLIRIPVVYSSFDEFWDSNTVPVGPQGKLISKMSSPVREQLRARLYDDLPINPDGRIAYEAFANAVKGRVSTAA
jgi:ubiquinone/menaquinone biosynthesis C-methylase UbiE